MSRHLHRTDRRTRGRLEHAWAMNGATPVREQGYPCRAASSIVFSVRVVTSSRRPGRNRGRRLSSSCWMTIRSQSLAPQQHLRARRVPARASGRRAGVQRVGLPARPQRGPHDRPDPRGADAAAGSRGARPDRGRRPLERRHGRDRPGARSRGPCPGRADARAGARARQGRRDVARAARPHRRGHLLPGRRLRALRRAFRLRAARAGPVPARRSRSSRASTAVPSGSARPPCPTAAGG